MTQQERINDLLFKAIALASSSQSSAMHSSEVQVAERYAAMCKAVAELTIALKNAREEEK